MRINNETTELKKFYYFSEFLDKHLIEFELNKYETAEQVVDFQDSVSSLSTLRFSTNKTIKISNDNSWLKVLRVGGWITVERFSGIILEI